MVISLQNQNSPLTASQVSDAINTLLAGGDYTGKKILLIIPDNTRSGPVGDIFKIIFDSAAKKLKALDCLVALGTHQPLTEQQICRRLDITPDQRRNKYASVKFFNHNWQNPETFTSVGKIPAADIEKITEGLFSEEVDVAVNKMIFDYDCFFIIGPVFPHEVVGFSGGHKYIFPGIAGPEIINFFHWLGAVITNPKINGCIDTPPRSIVEKAASFINVPHKLFAIVSRDNNLNGLFLGDTFPAWQKAARLSEKLHIIYTQNPYRTVLALAPPMYDDLWTAGKAMYKLEPIVADGGTIIIYALHITGISYTHGKFIDKIGYHVRDYFLKKMKNFDDIPRAVLAHSTHVKGIGTYSGTTEKPRINVVLATAIDKNRCEKLNLGYMDLKKINIADYEQKENQGVLVVRNAGETLYRLKTGLPEIS